MPDSIDLPSLRNLSLRSIDCLSDEFLDLYFNGCPLLESLSFIACDFLEEENVTFSAPQLKHLVIDTFNKGSDTPYNCKILVSAPNLISFQCCDYTSHEYCLENLSSLEVARFNMIVEEEYNEELDMFAPVYTKEDGRFMINCLKGISNVKSLTLNHHFLLVVAEAPDVLRMSPIPFRNLRFLKLDTWMGKAYIRAVMYILENSRDIETLVIEFSRVKADCINLSEYWVEALSFQQLKYIEVRNVQCCMDHELDLLRTFLKNVVNLEKMTVFISKERSTVNEKGMKCFTEEVLNCPRANSDVTIRFRISQ
ncbi:hypothetical protein AQUCO_06600024v1 [Aquilegia coerulea]|uniref:FBD domain-containing protein n=1 Tax=Aquilegia coerulea TaxID=218851 RepID=A0A2G5CC36_AQUCA|nr:hypothetical protein AQUCO_06600024v1 [Aquilegia coerulea]